jgi:hypothetical protein
MAKQICIKLGMYIMAPELISTPYFINPSYQSVCLHVVPIIVARHRLGKKKNAFVATQRLRKNVTAATNTRNNRIIGRVVFYAVGAESKKMGD